jgi:hypothetical protein
LDLMMGAGLLAALIGCSVFCIWIANRPYF